MNQENLLIQLPGGISFEMVFVEGGTFMMGSDSDDQDAYEDEQPRHPVELSSFWIGKYVVTQKIWQSIAQQTPNFKLEANPSYFKEENRPVETISWYDIQKHFLPAINQLSGYTFRLPTEAEWEYAARGGKYWREGYKYAGSDKLKAVGWYEENSDGKTHIVGQKQPNQLGLFDMSGNVYEWCKDVWDSALYKKRINDSNVKDPVVEAEENWMQKLRLSRAPSRVIRGGSYFLTARDCRVAFRNGFGRVAALTLLGSG